MIHNEYQRLHEERLRLLASKQSRYSAPNRKQLMTFEELVEAQIGCNKFFTLYDFKNGKFIKWHLVKELLGYSKREFTIEAINNLDALNIIYHEDIVHKRRYDKIIYNLLSGSHNFGIRMDSYCLSLRLIHKNGSIIPVRRRSIIFQASLAQPLTQLDEWEITNRYKINHVFAELIVENSKLRQELTEEFYKENLKELDVDIRELDLRILHYKVKGESNEAIAHKCNIVKQTVSNHHSKNFQELKFALEKELKNVISNLKRADQNEDIDVFRELCRTYGLYPVPDSLLRKG